MYMYVDNLIENFGYYKEIPVYYLPIGIKRSLKNMNLQIVEVE